MEDLTENSKPIEAEIVGPTVNSESPTKNDKGYLMVLYIMTFIGLFIILFGINLLMQPEKQRKIVGMVVVSIGIFDILAGYLFSKYLRPAKQ